MVSIKKRIGMWMVLVAVLMLVLFSSDVLAERRAGGARIDSPAVGDYVISDQAALTIQSSFLCVHTDFLHRNRFIFEYSTDGGTNWIKFYDQDYIIPDKRKCPYPTWVDFSWLGIPTVTWDPPDIEQDNVLLRERIRVFNCGWTGCDDFQVQYVDTNTIKLTSDLDSDTYYRPQDCNNNDASINPGAAELCDTIDNNCDGQIDEGCSCIEGDTQTCGITNVGACEYGTQTCSVMGAWGDCEGVVLPSTELCNAIDDNCNGEIDESVSQSCYTGPPGTEGVGVCQSGLQTCGAEGAWGACIEDVTPQQEICDDELDNDCDGFVDNENQAVCPCILTDAYWSDTEVTAGTKVKLTVEGEFCEGFKAYFPIWEDDTLFGDDSISQLSGTLTSEFISGKAEVDWYSVYVPDCLILSLGMPRPMCDPPEYYFDAFTITPTGATPSIKSQGPSSDGLLRVSPNLPPTQPDPFLIDPSRHMSYDTNVMINWSPAVDPEDDAVLYSLYWTDNSGANWYSLVNNYGYINTLGGKTRFTIEFSDAVAPPVCGDGTLDSGEECDDSNYNNGDGCSSVCVLETVCGDGNVEGVEVCDDNNIVDGDGCSHICTLECGDGTCDTNIENKNTCPADCRKLIGEQGVWETYSSGRFCCEWNGWLDVTQSACCEARYPAWVITDTEIVTTNPDTTCNAAGYYGCCYWDDETTYIKDQTLTCYGYIP